MNVGADNLLAPTHGPAHEARAADGAASTAPVYLFRDETINILIVDDEPKNLTVLETVLHDPGYRLVRADSPDQALLALVEAEFALLILDVRMPGMTGFELAKLIKERKKTAHVPIIFLTAYYNEDEHELEGYSTGAVDYLHKPLNPAILRSKVGVFAELHRKNLQLGKTNRALLVEATERLRAEENLRELNETLERRVTERTDALRESEERYRTLFNAVPMAVFVCDRHSVIQHYNRHAVALWGREPVCGVEQHCGSVNLWLPDGTLLPHTQSPIVEVLRTGIPALNVEVFIERPDGSRLPVLVNFAALKNAQGEIAGAITSFVDISESKRAESELRAAKATAEKANRAKSDFLSSMSHDLRTPLSAILGFAQLLESGSPPPTLSQKRNIDQILKAGWYLLEMINEILDLALIESGKLSVSMEAISLAAIVDECATMIGPQVQTRDITVSYPLSDIPYSVRADRTRLKQVLINLLSNAIKYNRVGGAIDVAFRANTPGRIRIEVRDTGEGMTPDKLAQLFQPFNRLGKEESAEQGTGIGLVLTKRLVELMGGAIGVESTVGVGSVFWFDLSLASEPLPAARADELTAAPPADIQCDAPLRTLLYVEDNPENMTLFEALIAHRKDIRLLTAMNANRGIEIARAAAPDVILMDIKMPGMSGIEALEILREDPSTAHIPIIALSANAMPDDIERCLALGLFRYLTKPIEFNELMDTLDAALNGRKMQPTHKLKKDDA